MHKTTIKILLQKILGLLSNYVRFLALKLGDNAVYETIFINIFIWRNKFNVSYIWKILSNFNLVLSRKHGFLFNTFLLGQYLAASSELDISSVYTVE